MIFEQQILEAGFSATHHETGMDFHGTRNLNLYIGLSLLLVGSGGPPGPRLLGGGSRSASDAASPSPDPGCCRG